MNPFEDLAAEYFVIVNDENQHSLWPSSLEVPDGWTIVFGGAAREQCIHFIESSWLDMRPTSLTCSSMLAGMRQSRANGGLI